MTAFDRRSAILDYVRRHGRASTRQLSERFGVSEVTIRTDLVALEESGWLARRHGGAEVSRHSVGEQPFDQRRRQHGQEKAEIARAAAALVRPGDTVLLDGSTTAYHLAQELRGLRDLTVITNNVKVAQAIVEIDGVEVLLIGGSLRRDTWSTVGLLGEEMLARLHAGQGFFGAAGLTLERGLTDADTREVQIKRAMVSAAGRVNALLDSSKFGQEALLTFAQLSQVDRIFTDAGLEPTYAEGLRDAGLEVRIV